MRASIDLREIETEAEKLDFVTIDWARDRDMHLDYVHSTGMSPRPDKARPCLPLRVRGRAAPARTVSRTRWNAQTLFLRGVKAIQGWLACLVVGLVTGVPARAGGGAGAAGPHAHAGGAQASPRASWISP